MVTNASKERIASTVRVAIRYTKTLVTTHTPATQKATVDIFTVVMA
jgi:hypothetical protein